MAAVGPGDRVLDLGTGDGRILIAAARRGASGTGVDIDPVLIGEARAAALTAGVAERTRFVAQDLFATPLTGNTVVTMFLLPRVNLRLRPRLLRELPPGTRIVSHAFDMADWAPDVTD
ncbi:Methyltransferase domain-containing protein [Sphingomonas rubra]|uniref:Methyltransferase domain-containing protein n=2 Tax=Sphingomonas rubra TaxID=634430 RepID=A0A1I5UNY5_9SPHN|nr:Methyltransferase domain-containing protein [Sphingomonas rubra]